MRGLRIDTRFGVGEIIAEKLLALPFSSLERLTRSSNPAEIWTDRFRFRGSRPRYLHARWQTKPVLCLVPIEEQ